MFEHFYKPAKSSLNCCYCYSPLYSVLGLFTTTRLEVKKHYSQGPARERGRGVFGKVKTNDLILPYVYVEQNQLTMADD